MFRHVSNLFLWLTVCSILLFASQCASQQPVCPVGYGVNNGSCLLCYPTGYNNIEDNVTECTLVSNCSSQKRCTLVVSDGTTDNACSQLTVHNLSSCAPPSVPEPFFNWTTTTPEPPPVTAPLITSPSQTETEIWAIALSVCFLLGLVWFCLFIMRRFQLCKHPYEVRIRELALSNAVFNRKAVAEACIFLGNRLGTRWPKLAVILLREHPEQPIVEYVNADMRGQSTSAKIECMLGKWKQLRGQRRNLNQLMDCLYEIWYTRLCHELCQHLLRAASLAEYFGYPTANDAANLVQRDGEDEQDASRTDGRLNDAPLSAGSSNQRATDINAMYDNTSLIRDKQPKKSSAANDHGPKRSVQFANSQLAEDEVYTNINAPRMLPSASALEAHYSKIAPPAISQPPKTSNAPSTDTEWDERTLGMASNQQKSSTGEPRVADDYV